MGAAGAAGAAGVVAPSKRLRMLIERIGTNLDPTVVGTRVSVVVGAGAA